MTTQHAIVLAAGLGKRMCSTRPKVLHEICGRSMLWFVLHELRQAGIADITLVASPALSEVLDHSLSAHVRLILQQVARGTGDAVRIALEQIPVSDTTTMLVVNADMPLLDAALFTQLLKSLTDDASMALATARMGKSSNFGRIERDAQQAVSRIIEVRDATLQELALEEMNVGLYAFREDALRRILPQLDCENAQREYYLTDAVGLFRKEGSRIVAFAVEEPENVLGINDRVELAQAQAVMNRRLCEFHMRNGVTIIDPATTYLEPLLSIGADTIIAPNTKLSGRTTIGTHAIIGPNVQVINGQIGHRCVVRESVLVESSIADDCQIGPFAHVRMETELARDVKIGNFVEVKRSHLAQGVRAGHLSYLGDAEIGQASNIGAGTITCNYDGERKHRTNIGAEVFIGSNSSLIAPIHVGDGALTGAGSVVTRDVPEGGRVVGNPARPLKAKGT